MQNSEGKIKDILLLSENLRIQIKYILPNSWICPPFLIHLFLEYHLITIMDAYDMCIKS